MIEGALNGTIDNDMFPPTEAKKDNSPVGQTNVSQASLRSAKPTWARTRPSALEPRQRIIVFMAGGATFSESRLCYEISHNYSKDVYLATSHMHTPNSFIEQVRQLSDERSMLHLPADREPPRAKIQPPEAARVPLQPPTGAMSTMSLASGTQSRGSSGSANGKAQDYRPLPAAPASGRDSGGRDSKEKVKDKDKKKKFFKF